ncbi:MULTISPECIES: 2-dehydropantoate 2-reductase [Thalassobaculum]|uniref:2-dehydropantoate 2-reductase n=1 Tax=Thalassobaculum litoreum DSM 18839 TaxID=1123362 RepID=A0A8G2BGE8_9PROT|nr:MULTISPECIES: 2-dehydropantoate 2-reductase [Thalassobaculum]SDF54470.1 2-dehydropantoate 2-reductase [Thalassobaculum litoreum DSM 18839]
MTSTASSRQRVAVIGLGGIGGAAAGALTHAGRHDVIACGRRPLERMRVDLPDESVEVAMTVLTDPADASPVDWVLLTTKAQDTDGAGAWLRALCGPDTTVAVMQNGIDHAERIASYAGGAEALPVIVYYNGERIADDHVRMRHISDADIALPDTDTAQAFIDLLEGTPIQAVRAPDFTARQWQKLLINIVVNPVTALTRQRQGVLQREDIQTLTTALLEEAAAVAEAEGAGLPASVAADTQRLVLTFPHDAGSSMYFDALAGRRLEAEALTGAVVRAGARHGIPTPMNGAMLALLRALSDGMGT